jgi:hypothetical protein
MYFVCTVLKVVTLYVNVIYVTGIVLYPSTVL